MSAQTDKKGFTIIEVVLVLAIAGLIFLMVFIALPALQRGQRDTQRKNDLSRVQSQVQNFQTASRGAIPTSAEFNGTFLTSYMKANGDAFTDPSGKNYEFVALGAAVVPTAIDATTTTQATVRIYETAGAICGTGGAATAGQGARKVALRIVLEGGGVSCVNN